MTSLVRKSAPIVALYWLLKRLLTYWFIRDVLPTLFGPLLLAGSWRRGHPAALEGSRTALGA